MARKKRTSEGSNDSNGSASRISLAAIEQDGSDRFKCLSPCLLVDDLMT